MSFISDFSGITDGELSVYQERVRAFHTILRSGTDYSDRLGWLDLPDRFSASEFAEIEDMEERICRTSDALVVIGVGGSYIGAKAAISALRPNFYGEWKEQGRPRIYFLGNNLSVSYTKDLFRMLDGKEVSVNVISKSGATLETVTAYALMEEYMKRRYGEAYRDRIYVTTDAECGCLLELARREKMQRLTIPKDVGGRFSVLTSAGLLPMAVAGIDIRRMMEGARTECRAVSSAELSENAAYRYAVLRHILYSRGKRVELLVSYEPKLRFFSEWWKQLFAESEGKNGKGIFPSYAFFSTDLHSLGQMIQEGEPAVFETVLKTEREAGEFSVGKLHEAFDEFSGLEGIELGELNRLVFESTLAAHTEQGVPNLVLEIPKLDEFHLGRLFYFFQRAVAMSGLLLGVNPFNQPGVEVYKKKLREKLMLRQ